MLFCIGIRALVPCGYLDVLTYQIAAFTRSLRGLTSHQNRLMYDIVLIVISASLPIGIDVTLHVCPMMCRLVLA